MTIVMTIEADRLQETKEDERDVAANRENLMIILMSHLGRFHITTTKTIQIRKVLGGIEEGEDAIDEDLMMRKT